jgi:hypothetical protein
MRQGSSVLAGGRARHRAGEHVRLVPLRYQRPPQLAGKVSQTSLRGRVFSGNKKNLHFNYELRITNYELLITNYELLITDEAY